MLFVGNSYGQEKPIPYTNNNNIDCSKINTHIIEYNFQTGTYTKNNLKLKINQPVVFKVININRFAYTLDIKTKDSIIGYSDLSGLEKIFKNDEIEKTKKQLNSAETKTIPTSNNIPLDKNDFIGNENEMFNEINEVNSLLQSKLTNKMDEIINAKINDSSTIINKIDFPKIDNEYSFHFTAQYDLANLYLSILEKHTKIISLWNDYLSLRDFINNPTLTLCELKKENNFISSTKVNFDTNKNILTEFDLVAKQFDNLYKAIKSNPEITKKTNYGGSLKLFGIIDNLNIQASSLVEQVEIIDFDKFKQDVNQIINLTQNIENKKELFEYVSDPIQPWQDVAVFKVKINKNEKSTSKFYNERDFSHREYTKDGIRYDISVGLAGSFYDKENFHKIITDASGVNKIYLNEKSSFIPSFVGFFTTSYRSASHFTAGLSIGLGLSTNQGTIAIGDIFIGPNITVGKDERVNLTGGISYKNLYMLNSNYKVGDIVPNGLTIENVSTKSYQSGFFLAFTYNLTKGVKDKLKQINNLK
jgi:hypothetical protein